MKKTINKKNKGFTIVELIVVMAIIAILILIAVPTFTKYIEDASRTAEMGTSNTIYKSSVAAVVDDYTESTRSAVPAGRVADNSEIVTNIIEGVSGGGISTADVQVPVIVYGYTTAPTARNSATPADAWEVYIMSTGGLADTSGDIYTISPNGNIYINGILSSNSTDTTPDTDTREPIDTVEEGAYDKTIIGEHLDCVMLSNGRWYRWGEKGINETGGKIYGWVPHEEFGCTDIVHHLYVLPD